MDSRCPRWRAGSPLPGCESGSLQHQIWEAWGGGLGEPIAATCTRQKGHRQLHSMRSTQCQIAVCPAISRGRSAGGISLMVSPMSLEATAAVGCLANSLSFRPRKPLMASGMGRLYHVHPYIVRMLLLCLMGMPLTGLAVQISRLTPTSMGCLSTRSWQYSPSSFNAATVSSERWCVTLYLASWS